MIIVDKSVRGPRISVTFRAFAAAKAPEHAGGRTEAEEELKQRKN